MKIRMMLALAAALPPSAAALPAPAFAMPVFDATNYAQNLLQAARALEQINHQVASLQNEAAMLAGMERNLRRIGFPELERVTSAMGRIDALMGEARGIDLRVDRLDERIRSLFPGAAGQTLARDSRVAQARVRLEAAMGAWRQAMQVQSQVAENVREDASLIADLARRSQGAEGSLQAQQAANQLLALGVKQQLQLQGLMAAEYRGAALDRARQAASEEEGRAATRRFIGSAASYPRRRD